MSKQSNTSQTRAEKLSLLNAMLGPDALARIRGTQPNAEPSETNVDPDRVEWHRNRLLERLRTHGREQAQGLQQNGHRSSNLDSKLRSLVDLDTIVQEHPAVIARFMKTMERGERAELLRKLPGPMARNLIRRMRDG